VQITHECDFSNNPLARAHIDTKFWFDDNSKTAQILNRVQFDVSGAEPEKIRSLGKTVSGLCVNKDTGRWPEDFFRQSGTNFVVRTQSTRLCQWLGWEKSEEAAVRQHIFEILLIRNLSVSKWPDKSWKSQCWK
jgi:hypothetical protein